MSVKVAIFQDDLVLEKGMSGVIRDRLNIKPECFNSMRQLKDLVKRKTLLEADVAFIDLSFSVGRVGSLLIIKNLLPLDTRRVITSGHSINDIKRDVIESLMADNYWQANPKELINLVNLGRITEEEKFLRGFSVGVEGGARIGLKMGIAPDIEIYDDKKYIQEARRGEKR